MDYNETIDKMKGLPDHLQWAIFKKFLQDNLKEHFTEEQTDDLFRLLRIAFSLFT